MSAERWATAKRKITNFYRDCWEMQGDGPAYFVFSVLLMVIASPFLLLEVLVYLSAGRDIGWFPESADRLQPDVRVATTAEVIAMMKPLQRPALHLVGTSANVRSRLGGVPDLPEGFQWPHWKNAPLAFLAQIDLAEIGQQSALPDLPDQGMLHFFYDQEQSTWGFHPDDRGSWRVFYSRDSAELRRTDPPAAVAQHGRFDEQRVEFREVMTYPSLERLSEQPLQVSDETWDEIDTLQGRDFKDLPRHQLGGLPNPVQGDAMELECQLASHGIDVGGPAGYTSPEAQALKSGAADWVLLLQLDTDDDTGMMWGDVGTLYFWIRTADLEARKFSDCWMVLQCS